MKRMNKKGALIDIDTAAMPPYFAYMLIIAVIVLLLVVTIFLGTLTYSCLFKEKCMMPFGMYGWGWPIMYGGGISIMDEHCLVNGVRTNCSEINSVYSGIQKPSKVVTITKYMDVANNRIMGSNAVVSNCSNEDLYRQFGDTCEEMLK